VTGILVAGALTTLIIILIKRKKQAK